MGTSISKRGSYDLTTSTRRNSHGKKKLPKDNTCISLTQEQIYEDLTKYASPILSVKSFNPEVPTESCNKSDTQSCDDEYKSIEEFQPETTSQTSGTSSGGELSATEESEDEKSSYDWEEAFKNEFCKDEANPVTKLSNEYSNVITAESIEKIRDILVKREECVVNRRVLVNIEELEEEEEEELQFYESEEAVNKVADSTTTSFYEFEADHAVSECESQKFYDAVGPQCDKVVSVGEPQESNGSAVRVEVQTPDIIRFSRGIEDFDWNHCSACVDTTCVQTIKRWKSCDLISSSVIYPVHKTTLDVEWVSKRQASMAFTRSTPNLFNMSSEDQSPEEIAEDQMRLWSEQANTDQEYAKSEILKITLVIKDLKYHIENLGTNNVSVSDTYQTLIKLMRDVNEIHATDFFNEVIQLKNSALAEIYDCLKLLQIKASKIKHEY